MGLIYGLSGFWLHGFSTLGLSMVPSIMGIVGLPASHLMAFMYDNIQIISTGLYGASKFLKWYLYQPLLYPTLYPSIYLYYLPTPSISYLISINISILPIPTPSLYPSIYLYYLPTTMPPIQTPKTYLQIFHAKLLKIIL